MNEKERQNGLRKHSRMPLFLLFTLAFLFIFSVSVEAYNFNVTNVTILPDFPIATDTLNCSAIYTGSNDKANISFLFIQNGTLQSYNATALNVLNNTYGEANVTITPLVFGDRWICSAKAGNVTSRGPAVNSSLKGIYSCDIGTDYGAVIVFLIFLMLLFAYLSIYYFKEYWPFRIFLLLLSISLILVLLFVSLQMTEQQAPPSKCQEDIEIYAEAWGHDIGDVAVAAQNIYYPVKNLTKGEIKGTSCSDGNITIYHEGIYEVDSLWSFSGGANTEYHLSILVNSVQQDKCHAERKIGTGGDVGSAGFTCLYELFENDIVQLAIENKDNTNDATIHDININLERIGL